MSSLLVSDLYWETDLEINLYEPEALYLYLCLDQIVSDFNAKKSIKKLNIRCVLNFNA
jgi:hypothetical protein